MRRATPDDLTLFLCGLLRAYGGPHPTVVEIGTLQMRTAVALAIAGGPTCQVVSIDCYDNERKGVFDVGAWVLNARRLMKFGIDNVFLATCRSQWLGPIWRRPIDFLWIDGDHSVVGVMEDIASWSPRLRPGGIICGDDYNHPSGMRRAVDALVREDGERYCGFEVMEERIWYAMRRKEDGGAAVRRDGEEKKGSESGGGKAV